MFDYTVEVKLYKANQCLETTRYSNRDLKGATDLFTAAGDALRKVAATQPPKP